MTDPAGSDNNLLDRLNALKPTTVNLDGSSKSVAPADTIERAKPATREDGLSDRLKSLRQQADSAIPAPVQTQPQSIPTVTDTDIGTQGPATSAGSAREHDSADDLLDTDDQTLEELLADLHSDEQWLEEVAAEVTRSKDDEHRRVTALLEELGTASSHEQEIKTPGYDEDRAGDGNSEDDSDREDMQRDVDDVLARAMDEVDWESTNAPEEKSEVIKSSGPPKDDQNTTSLDPFNLPAVPTELQEQSDLPETSEKDADFEADITKRMAALNGLGDDSRTLPSAPTSQVDELGLPVAPTFAPADRPVPGIIKRHGYTDEDSKTWCTVCLEDGAIKCLGCDDDVYCARCWREMHVGPSAGYEERGHQWEKFVKGR
ncbi:hypothetical protein PFICI_06962 [Pestalotiopsis fici W106-1]|uniref:Uncharacterized protein n=1 Tax=Pestalotiopsis fici (strain W106-1 / CGMCC3.15140) TaxID=1229662 RepID=W3X7C1_PESFW|nr:uncharacterized protein PFICI_06962 [Pestalotiopsis fici W106-1]ETS81960.1 hypothetical protein PFICI_06962 [Pestalotiopsis fici W106-1]